MKVIYTPEMKAGRVRPIRSWCMEPEAGAIEQAAHVAALPFTHNHVALLPDTHQGYGMPIGGVAGLLNAVVPFMVGVDIGCGMRAVRTDVRFDQLNADMLRHAMGEVRKRIPLGFGHHAEVPNLAHMPALPDKKLCPIAYAQYDRATRSLGTLGGGNHFIEIQKDEEGYVWIMIHSGSRNLGKTICDYYHAIADNLAVKFNSATPKAWKLAHLPADSAEGIAYVAEMNFALEFAKANRQDMMEAAVVSLSTVSQPKITFEVDIHHNYAALEHHYGENVWVHRKGATAARLDEIGIIPGSQGTASYIVAGLGNPLSFQSCSHGAGRAMSRSAATKNLVLADEIKKLDDQGIVHSIRNQKDLDEAAGSYKDISVVMAEQADLVRIVHTLRPMAVVKG